MKFEDKATIEKMRIGYETGNMSDSYDNNDENLVNIKHFIFNEETYNFFNLSVSEGRMFEPKNHYYCDFDTEIPVLLGDEYKGILSLGDTIEIGYYTMRFKAKVIGFISPWEYIVKNKQVVVLDRHIITPNLIFNNPPETEDEMFFQTAVTLDNINGSMKLREGVSVYDLTDFLGSCERIYGIEKISIGNVSYYITDAMTAMNKENLPVFVFLTVATIFYLILLLHFAVVSAIEKEKSKFAINILFGKGLKRIIMELFLKFTAVFACSHLIAAGVTSFLTSRMDFKYNYIWIAFSFLLFISIFKISIYLKNLPLWEVINNTKERDAFL